MWNEYELTYSYAAELRSEELTDISDIKKQINILKANIKKLGVVNVNAIEEYKEVSERYNFLKTQHDDMIKAEEALVLVMQTHTFFLQSRTLNLHHSVCLMKLRPHLMILM